MREIKVEYLLTDELEERLRIISEKYKEKGLNLSEDKQFEAIMNCGCHHDIDVKFKFHEWSLGLREDFK